MANIKNVMIDGKDVEYVFENSALTIGGGIISALSEGDHTVRIFTDSGAVDFVFGYKIVPPEPVDKTGMAISVIAIAAGGCVAIAFTA